MGNLKDKITNAETTTGWYSNCFSWRFFEFFWFVDCALDCKIPRQSSVSVVCVCEGLDFEIFREVSGALRNFEFEIPNVRIW